MTKSVQETARGLGLKSYDTALPLDWFKQACDICKLYDPDVENVTGHIVWCYDGHMFGYPVGLTHWGRYVVGAMAAQYDKLR